MFFRADQMKTIGFLSFGHWTPSPYSEVRTAADALLQSIELAVAAEELGARRRLFPRAPLRTSARLAVPAARGGRRADEEDRDRNRGHRHALREPDVHGRRRRRRGHHRGRAFATGHQPRIAGAGDRRLEAFRLRASRGRDAADMARRRAEVFLDLLKGEGFAQPNPRPMFPNPPGLLRLEPHSEGLRERIWWGSSSNGTAKWAATLGMNLQSSTLKDDETGEPLHVQQRKQIEAYREAWKEAGHQREPRVSVSRSIFALVDDRDRAYFGRDGRDEDKVGYIDANTRAIFGRSYAAEPDVLVKQLASDEAIAAADTLLLTVPNQLGVDYNAHVSRASSSTSLPNSGGADLISPGLRPAIYCEHQERTIESTSAVTDGTCEQQGHEST